MIIYQSPHRNIMNFLHLVQFLCFSADPADCTNKVVLLEDKISVIHYTHDWLITSRVLNSSICGLLSVPHQLRIPHCFDNLLDTINFDNFFSRTQRHTAYFGITGYSYCGITHRPLPLESNQTVTELCKMISSLLPKLQFNSVLINYYPHSNSCIPRHADNEPEICEESNIVTLSLGDTRDVYFFSITGHKPMAKLSLNTWDLLIFSKSSQFVYLHEVPASYNLQAKARLSLTFRLLRVTTSLK